MKMFNQIALVFTFALILSSPTSLAAQDDCFCVIASHADTVHCQAKQIRDLVKDELRKTDCYLKMRVTITKIKCTSARVRRRANTIKVAKWNREFDRLDSLIWELGTLIDETYDRSDLGQERPLNDCTPQFANSINTMLANVQAMRDTCYGYGLETAPGLLEEPYLNAPMIEPAPAYQPIPGEIPPSGIIPQPANPNPPGSILEKTPAPVPVPNTDSPGQPLGTITLKPPVDIARAAQAIEIRQPTEIRQAKETGSRSILEPIKQSFSRSRPPRPHTSQPPANK